MEIFLKNVHILVIFLFVEFSKSASLLQVEVSVVVHVDSEEF